MRAFVILVALGLSGCAASPGMETALAPLDGQPVQVVFEKLGPPTSSTPAGADTVHQWRSAKVVYGASSRANVLPASEGGAPAYGGMAIPYTCDVVIVADSEGRIKSSLFGEQAGGCRESARKLSQVALADPR